MKENNSKPIRIAHIVGKMVSGGVESVVMNYYRHLDKTKYQFDFIIDKDSTVVPYDEISSMGGKIYKISSYSNIFRYKKDLTDIFRKNNYKIVHSHMNSISVFPLSVAKKEGIPIRIAHNHSTAGKGEYFKNIIKYTLKPFSRVYPTHFCACSELAGRWLFGNKCYDFGKVTLIKNAIDISDFRFDLDTRNKVRKDLGIDDKFVIGHVGRFMPQKNHDFLIDVFYELSVLRKEAMLILVGDGELLEKIKNKVSIFNLENKVLFLGTRTDVSSLLQCMDLFLLPSIYEGLGIVAIESQACGLETIVSEHIPKEAKVTELFKYCSLKNDTAKKWAEKIISAKISYRTSRENEIISYGYEIMNATRLLEGYYNEILFNI